MKTRHFLMLMTAGLLLAACGTLRETPAERRAREERESALVTEAVRNGDFHIDIDRMIPFSGAVRSVNGYSIVIKEKKTIASALPYFGQARRASFNGSNAMDFKADMASYQYAEIKDGYMLRVLVNTKEDRFQFDFQIYNDGAVTLDVHSDNRDPITYMGTLLFENEP